MNPLLGAASRYMCQVMKISRKIPIKVLIGLLVAIFLDTSIQIFWKSAVLALPGGSESWMPFASIFREPLFLGVIFIMSLQFFNWMSVLSRTDLSFAQPVTALSYVSVGVLSVLFFHEPVDAWQMLGIALVLAGVWFISRTDHTTPDEGGEAA